MNCASCRGLKHPLFRFIYLYSIHCLATHGTRLSFACSQRYGAQRRLGKGGRARSRDTEFSLNRKVTSVSRCRQADGSVRSPPPSPRLTAPLLTPSLRLTCAAHQSVVKFNPLTSSYFLRVSSCTLETCFFLLILFSHKHFLASTIS